MITEARRKQLSERVQRYIEELRLSIASGQSSVRLPDLEDNLQLCELALAKLVEQPESTPYMLPDAGIPERVTAEDVRWMLKQSDHDDGPQCRIEHAETIGALMWNACLDACIAAFAPPAPVFRDLTMPVDPQIAEYELIMNAKPLTTADIELMESLRINEDDL